MASPVKCPYCGEWLAGVDIEEMELTFDGLTLRANLIGECFKCGKQFEWETYFEAADDRYNFKEVRDDDE